MIKRAIEALVVICCFGASFANSLPTAQAQTTVKTPQAGQNPFSVLPSATDREITTFDEPHLCWLPTAAPRNQLVVFIPGTNGAPRSRFPYLETAAGLGYHVISLMYPDSIAAQSLMNDPNPQAYVQFRTAIIQGGQYPPTLKVSRADSIENRLQKLLVYLSSRQPGQGWNQFLDNSNQVNWSKLVVTGHSQGGGHTYMIAKLHEVARAIMLGSPKDFSRYFGKPPDGFDSNTKTPLDRFFAFNHMQDRKAGCNHDQQMQTLTQMGLTSFGSIDADHPPANYNHAHLLFTNIPFDANNPGSAHSSVLGLSREITPEANAICSGAWRYMFSEPVR